MGNKSSKGISKEKMDKRIQIFFEDLNQDLKNTDIYESMISQRNNFQNLENSQFLNNSTLFNSILRDSVRNNDFNISKVSKSSKKSKKIKDSGIKSEKQEEKDKKKAEKYNSKAKVYFSSKKYFKALKYYKKSFKLNPDTKYTNNIARCFLKLKRPDASIEAMSISIFIAPYDFDMYRLAGIFAFNQFKKSLKLEDGYQCEDFFRNAYEIEPNSSNSFNYFLSRKMIYLVKQQKLEKEKKELIDYLNSNKFSSEEINQNFLKETFFSKEIKSPKYLFCCITLDLMKDPIITPFGYSYEKKEFMEWCKTSGHKDPMTNKWFWSKQLLVDNKVLKRYTDKFLRKNPWVFESDTENNDWLTFEFL
jgi:STIP1 family protein 1